MTVKECTNREEWQKQEGSEFLQSWDWGEFQESVGKKVMRLQIIEEGKVVDQVQGFEFGLSFLGKYLYIPRLKILDLRFKDIIEYLANVGFIFLRIEPLDKVSYDLRLMAYVCNRQPAQTLVLDITKPEIELLGEMHPKTRYNIHLAVRKGVVVKEEKNVEIFWQLNKKTTERDQFKSHGFDYYQKMLENPLSRQLTAYYNNEPIASSIFIVYNKQAVYLHGASDNKNRNLMSPYLLQWEGIKLAKKNGSKMYDFWGVSPKLDEGEGKITCFHNYSWAVGHKWTGITRFKAGFGGEYKNYPEAVEIILRSGCYKLYKFAKKVL